MTVKKSYITSNTVTVIGVPFNGGQMHLGVEKGPAQLVESGILNQIESLGWKVKYTDNTEKIKLLRPKEDPTIVNLKQPQYVSSVAKMLYNQVYQEASKGRFVLTLGGDHSIALGSLTGILIARPDACVIWVDAHAVKY